jgi:3-keto-disaccharide hydrolase
MRLAALLMLSMCGIAQKLPDLYHDEVHGDPPFLYEQGWKPLLNGKDLSGWHAENGGDTGWFTTPAVTWRRVFEPTRLHTRAGLGDRIVNGKDGKAANLVSDATFGSFQLYLEFMLAKGSNSGVYLHGLYEIQIFDSYGFNGPLTPGDCGGVYERDQGGGSAPMRNACKPPGEWQSLRIWFQAGGEGKRPRVLRVLLNETLVQENVELPGPTVSHMKIAEGPRGPIMLQGDHGPVAYRNIWVKE